MGVTAEDGVLIIDDPVIEALAHKAAAEWGVTAEEAVVRALEEAWARRAERPA